MLGKLRRVRKRIEPYVSESDVFVGTNKPDFDGCETALHR